LIEIDKATALMLYLSFFLFLYLGAWFISYLKERKKKGVPPLYRLSTCEYCAFQYLAKAGTKITACPQCQSYNLNGSEL